MIGVGGGWMVVVLRQEVVPVAVGNGMAGGGGDEGDQFIVGWSL